jgi:hypothetical protein
MWQSSNIWERRKNYIHKENKRRRIRGMLATIQFRIFGLPATLLKTGLKYTKLQLNLLFCMGVKRGF